MAQLLVETLQAEKVVEAILAADPLAGLGTVVKVEPPCPQPLLPHELVKAIGEAIRPTAKTPMRSECLRFALRYGDTFSADYVDGDPSLRNGLGALSKALRPFAKYDVSPIDILAVREKHFDKNGAYLGTRYTPTKLGQLVYDYLTAEKAL